MKTGSLLICCGGFLLGLLAVSLPVDFSGDSGGNATVAGGDASHSSLGPRSTSGGKVVDPKRQHNLAGLLRLWPELNKGDLAVRRELERLDAPALKQLITELAVEVNNDRKNDVYYALRDLLGLAGKQLFRLEGEQAMAWVEENLQAIPAFDAVIGGLVSAAGLESPDLANRWNREDAARRGEMFPYPIEGFMENLTYQGAEEVVRVGRLFGELPRGLGANGFPDDFDFHRVLTGVADNEAKRGRGAFVQIPFFYALDSAVHYWTAKDRPSAWKGICEAMAVNRNAAGYVSSYVSEIRQAEGDRRALEIFAEHFDQIPQAAKFEALTAAEQAMDANCDFWRIDDLITLLPQDGDRVIMARRSLNPFGTDLTQALTALEKLGSESLQVEAMEAEARKIREWVENKKDASTVRTYFNGLMEQTEISEGGRQRIEAVLPKSEAE